MDGSEPERHKSWRQANHAKLCSDLQAVQLRDSGQLWQRRAVTLSNGPSLSLRRGAHRRCGNKGTGWSAPVVDRWGGGGGVVAGVGGGWR